MNISFEKKCETLANIWTDEEGLSVLFKAVIDDYNLSFPYAFGLVYGDILALDSEAEKAIENCFDVITKLLDKVEDVELSDIVKL